MKKLNISKNITILGSALALLFLGINLSACTDCCDDLTENVPSTDNNEIENIEGEDLSNPKQYFENTAKLLMDYFDANKQKAVAKFLMDFTEVYGDYVMDSTEVDAVDQRVLTDFSRNTARAILSGNYAAARGVDLWSFADYSGIFEPNAKSMQWERTGKSSDLIIRFELNGSNCELKIAATDGDWSAEINDKATAKVPKKFTFSLTEGSITHMTGVAYNDFNVNGHTFTVNETVTIADLTVKGTAEGKDSEIKGNQSFLIGDKVIATGIASITGSQLCDRNAIQKAIETEDVSSLQTFYQNGAAEIDILGRVQIKGDLSSVYEIVEIAERTEAAYDEYYDKWWGDNSKFDALYNEYCSVQDELFNKYDSGEYTWDEFNTLYNSFQEEWNQRYDEFRAEADKDYLLLDETLVKQSTEDLNEIMKCRFEFARNGQKQGDIILKAVYEEDEWEGWWTAMPVLQFNDGSIYGFDEYFGNGNFSSTENIFMNLVETYQRVLGIE